MKLNKKIKYSLSILGLTGLSIVPLSLSLIGCSKSNDLIKDKKESREINQEFDQNFFEDTIDLKKAPIGVDQEQYKFLSELLVKNNDESQTEINKKMDNIENGFHDESEAKTYAKFFLKDMNKDILTKILLINLNKDSYLVKDNSKVDSSAKKSLYTVEDISYNPETKTASFIVNYEYDSVYKNNDNELKEKIEHFFKVKLSIGFYNVQFLGESYKLKNINKYIPVLTINKENIKIKYLSSESNINIDDYFDKQNKLISLLLKEKNINENKYRDAIEMLKEFKNYWLMLSKYINNIKNLDFNGIEFIENSENIYNTPFTSRELISINQQYNNQNFKLIPYNIGVAIVNEILDKAHENYKLKGIIRIKLGIPIFNLIDIDDEENSFNFVTTDPNAVIVSKKPNIDDESYNGFHDIVREVLNPLTQNSFDENNQEEES